MSVVLRLMSIAVFATVTCKASVASEHPRLNEIELDMELMGHKLPIDPDGADGPKRIAGYFALNRTEVRDRCEQVTLAKCVAMIRPSAASVQAAEMFYFFFESRSDPKNDPVVLWMTGAIIASTCQCFTCRRQHFRLSRHHRIRLPRPRNSTVCSRLVGTSIGSDVFNCFPHAAKRKIELP